MAPALIVQTGEHLVQEARICKLGCGENTGSEAEANRNPHAEASMRFVGLDISAKTVQVFVTGTRGGSDLSYPNDASGRSKLQACLRRRGPVRAVMEATSLYGLDLAVLLQATEGIEIMVVNPRQTKAFATAQGQRGKTDRVDARMLASFAQVMDWKPWAPPPEAALTLRQLARRRQQLVEQRTAELNHLHAVTATDLTSPVVSQDIQANIRALTQRIADMTTASLEVIQAHPELRRAFDLLKTIDGIADVSALRILGEIAILPEDMDARQLVAHAGLDPQPRDSGARRGQRRISKRGNKYLRHALYMPAINARKYNTHVAAYHDALTGRGKEVKQATVAVMRKLLHTIWGMLHNGTAFDEERFYRLPKPLDAAA